MPEYKGYSIALVGWFRVRRGERRRRGMKGGPGAMAGGTNASNAARADSYGLPREQAAQRFRLSVPLPDDIIDPPSLFQFDKVKHDGLRLIEILEFDRCAAPPGLSRARRHL